MESNSDWYVAESYRNLETIGGIFEKDGKEYINVVLKSGKVRAARVYRSGKSQSRKPNQVIYNIYNELGFKPKGFIYIVRHPDEEKLNGYCHWHPAFGAYLKCTEDIFDLPFGCKIEKLDWIDISQDDCVHLLPVEEIRKIVKNKNLWYNIYIERERYGNLT